MRALIAAVAAICMVGCDSAPVTPPAAAPAPLTCQELFIARDVYIRRMMASSVSDNIHADAAAALALEASLGHCLQ